MSSIGLALEDVGLAVRLQEMLEAAGHDVQWDGALAGGPKHDLKHNPDLITLNGDGDPSTLARTVQAWLDHDPPAAILLVGGTERAQSSAQQLKATFVHADAEAAQLLAAVERATRFRHALRMSIPYARSALELARAGTDLDDAIRIIRAAQKVNLELVRESLRSHVHDYVTSTDLIATLREHRALEVPDIEFSKQLDGAITVHTAVNAGLADAGRAGRSLWAMVSTGAATLTPEPPDRSTDRRRAVAELRDHIRARQTRLQRATAYDVLEVVRGDLAGIAPAFQALATRYSPERLSGVDLGNLQPMVGPMWEQIVKSAKALSDHRTREGYDQMLAARGDGSSWSGGRIDAEAAEAFYQRGQAALVAGDAFKALSEMAAACRHFPNHPDYETALAWARYRAELARGKAQDEVVGKQRAEAEALLVGRRPWPRALVVLALLCISDDDPNAARWHLREALACDPNLPQARQLLSRLKPVEG